MTSVYPREGRPDGPPTYEQATYYPQAPPVPNFLGIYPTSDVLQPQPPPVGMYSTYATVPPPMNMYPTPTADIAPKGPPIGTPMLIETQSLLYGDIPIQCTCPHCHRQIITRVERKTGLVSWLICGGIVLVGGWLGCCLIPFCIDSLKDTDHYCPNCAVLLGTRRRM